MSKYIVYALVDSRNQEIFYVGKSCSGMDKAKRHTRPWSFKDHNQRKIDRVLDILANGGQVEVVVLKVARGPKDLVRREHATIKQLLKEGKPLLNKVVNRGRPSRRAASDPADNPTPQIHQQPLPQSQA